MAAPLPGGIDRLTPRDGKQPPFRIRRAAIPRPIRQRRSKRLRKRIFGGSYISRARNEKGDQLAIAAAGDSVRDEPRIIHASSGPSGNLTDNRLPFDQLVVSRPHKPTRASPRAGAPRPPRGRKQDSGMPRRSRN